MTDKTLAMMQVRLAGADGNGIKVSLEDFMKFDQEINRSLDLLEATWEDFAAPEARKTHRGSISPLNDIAWDD